jgi:hypothetical protein
MMKNSLNLNPGLDLNRCMIRDTLDAMVGIEIFVQSDLEDGRATLANVAVNKQIAINSHESHRAIMIE